MQEIAVDLLVTVLGVVLLIEGIPWFLSPPGVKNLLRQILLRPERQLRLAGFAAMLLGLLLVRFGVW
jgi:uncharacterized protein YjeT (DUF2065 family)